MTPVSITTIAENAWYNVNTAEAVLETPESIPRVMADDTRLQQLFENLFRNAVEHGGPDVRVTVDTTTDGFYVADNGTGITPSKRDRIFETGYTTDERGTGFGLSIVQQIVTGHEWEIQIAESPDGGAQFEISGVDFVV